MVSSRWLHALPLALHCRPDARAASAGRKKGGRGEGLVLKYTMGKMTWGAFFRSPATTSLPTGGTSGRSRRGRQRPDGGKFYKNICSIWMVQIFSKTWAQPKLIFHKTFANIYGFFFSFSMWTWKQEERKNVATCMFLTSYFQVLWLFQA